MAPHNDSLIILTYRPTNPYQVASPEQGPLRKTLRKPTRPSPHLYLPPHSTTKPSVWRPRCIIPLQPPHMHRSLHAARLPTVENRQSRKVQLDMPQRRERLALEDGTEDLDGGVFRWVCSTEVIEIANNWLQCGAFV